ncbi:MAG: YHS domain-containing (seleno)protein [Phormidesmis sp.]
MTNSAEMNVFHMLPTQKRISPKAALLASGASLLLALSACTPAARTPGDRSATGSEAAPENIETAEATESNATSVTNKVYAKDGVAIGGADPVAYFTQAAFVPGSADYIYEWQGVSWQFATAENRDLFANDPKQYAPQYGGYCAWAAAQNALAAIDPNAWSVIDGKLYLNANKRIQVRWLEDVPGNIDKANSNWPSLAAK